jgi:hypothetical protein
LKVTSTTPARACAFRQLDLKPAPVHGRPSAFVKITGERLGALSSAARRDPPIAIPILYVDDFLILCRDEHDAAWVERRLRAIFRGDSPAGSFEMKTCAVGSLRAGLDFLGSTIRLREEGVLIRPQITKLIAFREKISAMGDDDAERRRRPFAL